MELRFGPVKETEKTQFKDQMKAFKTLASGPQTLLIDGKEIEVKVNFLQFNTGVNNIAMNQGVGSVYHRSHWYSADKVNEESLNTLLGAGFVKDKQLAEKSNNEVEARLGGWVKKYLDNMGAGHEAKKQDIIQLAKEVGDIFSNKKHHGEKEGRYELGKRIAYLSYLIDAVPAFNCKSGKDRTGLMDVEIKALATQLKEGRESGKLSTEVDKERRQRFYLDPINFEIQRLNSGTTGNKVMNSNSTWLHDELGDDLYDEVKGNCNSGV